MTILVSINISYYLLLTPVLGLALGTVIISIFSYFFILTYYERVKKILTPKPRISSLTHHLKYFKDNL